MTKDVLVSVKGLQYSLGEDDDQRIETINRGKYYVRNQKSFVTFDELQEGTDVVTSTMIKFDKNVCEVTKKGALSTHMVFESGKKNLTNYQTPFGSFVIGIDTNTITINETKDRIVLSVSYKMDINYEFLADCVIDIVISSAGITSC